MKNENEEIEEMKVIEEEPAFTLRGGNGYSNQPFEILDVSFSELRNSEVGKIWETVDPYNCGRDSRSEQAEVIYKNEHGVAILFHIFVTTDSPEPVERKVTKLVWYELRD